MVVVVAIFFFFFGFGFIRRMYVCMQPPPHEDWLSLLSFHHSVPWEQLKHIVINTLRDWTRLTLGAREKKNLKCIYILD